MRLVKRRVNSSNNFNYCNFCQKNSYLSSIEANGVIEYLKNKKNIYHLRVYRCPEEHGYHLTSKQDY